MNKILTNRDLMVFMGASDVLSGVIKLNAVRPVNKTLEDTEYHAAFVVNGSSLDYDFEADDDRPGRSGHGGRLRRLPAGSTRMILRISRRRKLLISCFVVMHSSMISLLI